MRCKTEATEIKLKLQAIKDKIAEHDDSLFSEKTGKLGTGLSCHHNFNCDKSHKIKSGIEKDVDHFTEELDRVLPACVVNAQHVSSFKEHVTPLITCM